MSGYVSFGSVPHEGINRILGAIEEVSSGYQLGYTVGSIVAWGRDSSAWRKEGVEA